jgi:predicted deacylase
MGGWLGGRASAALSSPVGSKTGDGVEIVPVADVEPREQDGRVIDRLSGAADGPTLIVIGGVHGNEPAGVAAARRVLARLRESGAEVAGEVVALAGNRRALAAGRRYLVRDLNRQWTEERIAAARAAAGDAEEIELVELAAELDRVRGRARGPVFVLDLHTTSADGIPFAVVGESEAGGAFAAAFPLPGIVGLEKQIDGVLTGHLGRLGCATLAIEGGQSQSAHALANLEAAVTIGVSAAGVMAAEHVPGLDQAQGLLARARGDLPHLIEVVARHEVLPEHGFRMEPGFANIQRTGAGTLLARDGSGEIRAPFDGLVLLPLYQPQGSDGFFYGRELAAAAR